MEQSSTMQTPSLDNLYLFIAVADAGGFSRAAERLDLPVATLSRRIAALEKELNIPLFKRNTRNVSLTTAGEEFYASLVPALESVQSAMNELSNSAARIEGHIRLTTPADFARLCLSKPLSQFLSLNPHVRLDLNLNSHRMDLVKEHVDLAIRIGHLSDSALYATHLFDMPLKLYASPSYLASLPCIQTPEDLKHCNLIRLRTNGDSPVGLLRLEKGKQTVEQTLQGNLTANDMGVVISLTEAAAGIALIPEAFISNQVASGTLVNVLPDWRSIKTPVHAVTTARNPPARVKALVAYLKEQLAYLHVKD